jgi:hypothetical protein
MSFVDENAFGILISYFDVENDEYGLDSEEFVEKCSAFRFTMLDLLSELPVELGARALDLGHGFYVEYAEPETPYDPLAWIRNTRERLREREIETVAVLAHGSRWLPEDGDTPEDRELFAGAVSVLRTSRVSEPFRRALWADTAAQPAEDEDVSWGPGLYLDLEALEALGRKLKNDPTPLEAASGKYFRLSR